MGNNGSKVLSEPLVRMRTQDDNVVPEPSDEFVCTSHVQEIADRALAYLDAGYPVHFAGAAGTGKTTLALHIAAKLGQASFGVRDANDRVGQSTQATQSIARDISGVDRSATDMASCVDQVKASAGDLSRLADQLNQSIRHFQA